MEKRDNYSDRWRGFAVFLMLGANLAGSSLLPPHPNLLRLLFSLPAPIFIGLAGYYSFQQPTKKLFFRGAILLAWASCLDFLGWSISPFQEWDVLYVLGLGLWLSVFLKKSWGTVLGLVFIVLSLGSFAFPELLHRGWFPPLPWLGIFLLGYWKNLYHKISKFAIWGLLAGVYLVCFPPETRMGYSEWYYPISFFSLAFAAGVLGWMDRFPRLIPGFRWLETFGKNSLTVYVLSSFIIAWGTSRWVHGWKLSLFALLWLTLCVFFSTFIFRFSKKHDG